MALRPISKKVSLTATFAKLASNVTFGVELINNSGATLEYKLNGGDDITLKDSQREYFPEVRNSEEIEVKGSGTLGFVIFQSRA